MSSVAGDVDIKRVLRTLRLLWAAMLFSLCIYLIIGHYMKGQLILSASANLALDKLRIVLYAISILTITSIKYIRGFLLSRPSDIVRTVRMTGPLQHPVFSKYTTSMIVSLALAESVGIYGFVLSMIGGKPIDLYLLLLVSAATMYYYRPREDELAALLSQYQRQPNKSL
nr:putative uncharacterized protein [uncultured bacterium]